MNWSYKFNDSGGYDCMTDSLDVYEGDRFMFKLDLVDYGQVPGTGENYEARGRAETVARRIVGSLNASKHIPFPTITYEKS